jgi:hypothetical protein
MARPHNIIVQTLNKGPPLAAPLPGLQQYPIAIVVQTPKKTPKGLHLHQLQQVKVPRCQVRLTSVTPHTSLTLPDQSTSGASEVGSPRKQRPRLQIKEPGLGGDIILHRFCLQKAYNPPFRCTRHAYLSCANLHARRARGRGSMAPTKS